VLILFVVAMVNSFAFRHYARWDFSRDQKYALSDYCGRSEFADGISICR
jgi:hypothetical protein